MSSAVVSASSAYTAQCSAVAPSGAGALTSALRFTSACNACLSPRRTASTNGESFDGTGVTTGPAAAPAASRVDPAGFPVVPLLLLCAATLRLVATIMAASDTPGSGLTRIFKTSLELRFYYARGGF